MAEYRGDVQNGGLQMSKNRWRGDLWQDDSNILELNISAG